MDATYYRFRQIMKLVEEHPNDMQLGEKIREYYWTDWKKVSANHLTPPVDPDQLKLFDVPVGNDTDREDAVILGED